MKESSLTPYEHKEYFIGFCKLVTMINATTPHLTMVAESAKNCSPAEQLWRGCCYSATYNYPAAEILWQHFPCAEGLLGMHKIGQLESWITEHWVGIPLRRERKAVNAPKRLTENLVSLATWAEKYFTGWHDWVNEPFGSPSRYESAWEDFGQVKYAGRYIQIRFLEYLRRVLDTGTVMPDIRPIGGEYPRQTLSLMYPNDAEALLGNDSKENIYITNSIAKNCMEMLSKNSLQISYYAMQSLLCEYKQAILGKKQFPGHSLDSELGYLEKTKKHWGEYKTQMFDVRLALFPRPCLGEICGWNGKRLELAATLADHGYLWCDMIYDYKATTDLVNPVMWRLK